MKNFDFLKKYQKLQLGIMYDRLFNLDFTTISFCKNDNSVFWNLALVNKIISKKQLKKIENKLTSLDRKPLVYFENKKELETLIDFLKKT